MPEQVIELRNAEPGRPDCSDDLHQPERILRPIDLKWIEAGQIDLRFESVVCQSVIRDVVAAASPEAIRKGLALEVMLPAKDLVVRSDRRALVQCVKSRSSISVQRIPMIERRAAIWRLVS